MRADAQVDVPRHLDRVRDQRIHQIVPLASPGQMLEEMPLEDERTGVVVRGRDQVEAILNREDDRLLVVVGPCSVHDMTAARDYARAAGRHAPPSSRDDLCIAMRVYFEKPRTTTGWKGLINDPHLDGSGDVNAGLRMARRLLLEILDLGLPWAASSSTRSPRSTSRTRWPGARSARAPRRARSTASSAPACRCRWASRTGTDGNVQVAVDAVRAAAVPHAFAGMDEAGQPGDPPHQGQPRLPRDPARRAAARPTTAPRPWRARWPCCARRACRSGW